MLPRDDRESRKLWERAYADAFRYAMYRTRDRSRAEDLAGEALVAALDPDRSPWQPEGSRSLSLHVINLVREGVRAHAAKRRVRDDPVNSATVEELALRPVPTPDADVLLRESRIRGERRLQAVRQQLDQFAKKVLDLFGEDLAPAEQAERLGAKPGIVYEARRRIAEHIRKLPDQEDEESK